MSTRRKRILVVEDDKTLCRLVSEQLQAMGHIVATAHSWAEAKATL